MRAANKQLAVNRPSLGSKQSRLAGIRKQLGVSSTRVVFDAKVKALLREFSLDKVDFARQLNYLNNLRAVDGLPFCRSIKNAEDYVQQIEDFGDVDYTSFRWNQNYQRTLEELKQYFSRAKLDQLQFECEQDIWNAVPRTDTHSGWCFVETGLRYKGEYKGKAFGMMREGEMRAKSNGTFGIPLVPGLRTQASGEYDSEGGQTGTAKHKTRLVLMVAFTVIISELKFSRPIQDWIASQSFYAGGKDDVAISRYLTAMKERANYWISLDYSGYDRSISSWLIEDAFSILKCCFRTMDEELWKVIVHDFIHKEIISVDHNVRSNRGVPSGSMFTQLIDTVVNLLMVRTYLRSIGVDGNMMIMGDDNLLFTKVALDHTKIATYISKNFGIKVNADKTAFGSVRNDDPEFLSSEWRFDGRWRHPHILLSRLLFPEHRRKYDEDSLPEQVIASYIRTYPIAMRKLIDVDAFIEHCLRLGISISADHDKAVAKNLAGYEMYRRMYLRETSHFYGIVKFGLNSA